MACDKFLLRLRSPYDDFLINLLIYYGAINDIEDNNGKKPIDYLTHHTFAWHVTNFFSEYSFFKA